MFRFKNNFVMITIDFRCGVGSSWASASSLIAAVEVELVFADSDDIRFVNSELDNPISSVRTSVIRRISWVAFLTCNAHI